jgi:signal transduction histidine kinase
MMLLFSLLAGILLAGTCLAFYVILRRSITAQFDRRLMAAAQPVVADLVPDPAEDDASQLNGPNEDDVTKLDIRDEFFELLDEAGRVLQLSKNLRGRALVLGALPLNAGAPVIRASGEPVHGNMRWILIPVQRGNARRLLLLAMPSVEIAQTLSDIRGFVYWLLPAALLLTAAISVWYVSRSLRPIADLTRHAASLAARAGDVSGSRLWTPLPVSNPGDELGRLAATFNHLFERIDAAVSQLRQFVTDASHELRTPLTVLRGETSLTLSAPREAGEYRKSLEFMEEELDKLSRIVQNLFTLSMADAGQLAISRQPLCLNEVLEEACALAVPLGKPKGIAIDRHLDREIPYIGDEALLRQLFLIFLDNAIKYSAPDSRVHVDLATCAGRCRIRFADEGCGIAPEQLPHVFERFYRAAPESAQGHGGGLGLAIAQALARAHNGSIECASTPGRGSTFSVYLPANNGAT